MLVNNVDVPHDAAGQLRDRTGRYKRFNRTQWMVGGGVVLLAATHDVALTSTAVRAPSSGDDTIAV